MNNASMIAMDIQSIWHPCTQHKDHEFIPPIPIQSAKGIYLFDFDGNRYIDCISSWWVNLFGHCHPYITRKLQEQAQKLDHVLLAGFSHQGIITYSKRLLESTGLRFDKCFYADNGSSAIEVALKMSFHQHRICNPSKKRNLFLSLSNSYHGETIGALSLSDVKLYKQTYEPLLFDCITIPTPRSKKDIPSSLGVLDGILKNQGDRICAFILEPLVQCAGNMQMYPKEFIPLVVAKCKPYKIDIIFDEIAVGFGRTGTLFAFEQCDVIPDFLCLSKGITGGVLPLSVVLTHQAIFEIFYDDYESQKAFLHSHSYTGNALAIACAHATLDLFQNENILASNQIKARQISTHFAFLNNHPKIKNPRQRGMIFAFDLNLPYHRSGIRFYQEALKKGLLLRPLGDTIYFMPPYIITEEEIALVAGEIQQILKDL